MDVKIAQINDLPLLETSSGNIVLFHPHIPAGAAREVVDTLHSRWIGQGPKVEEFERRFSDRFADGRQAIAVGSGTDALHLAYILAGIGPGDEVVTPVFTCTATNIPFLYMGAKVVFADIQAHTLNIDPQSVAEKVSDRTKAIVCVHYGGLPCDMDELRAIADQRGVPIIEDAAHAVGGTYRGRSVGAMSEFTMFSFQAIKHITTGDGGLLTLGDPRLTEKARRIRWFGIDRTAKQQGIWENDITEIGYKYQMTDLSASLGLAALDEIDETLTLRKALFQRYVQGLRGTPGITVLGAAYEDREHAAWLCTVLAERRSDLQRRLRERQIESGLVHFRNDRYSIFAQSRGVFPQMDAVEDRYLVLPLHTKLTVGDVDRVCQEIRAGW